MNGIEGNLGCVNPDRISNSSSNGYKKGENMAEEYRVYKRRWFMLGVVSLLNLSNAIHWIALSPVANYASIYYGVTVTSINWFSLIYFICFAVVGLPCFWLLDSLGLRSAVITANLLNGLGGLIKAIGTLSFASDHRYEVALFGQVLCALSQPLLLSMPTKLAALWFGDNERTMANAIGSLSNPLGVLIANLIAAVVAVSAEDVGVLVRIIALPGTLSAVFVFGGFCWSLPPTPPSSSAELKSYPFKDGIKMVFKSRPFLLLMLVTGFGVGSFSTISSLLQQLICPFGYSNLMAGISGALVIVGGLLLAAFVSIYTDRTKNYETTSKVLALLLAASSCLMLIATNVYDQPVLLCVATFFFGGFALAALPVFLELGVECTYPVAEGTSSGLLWMTGQAIGAVMMIALPASGMRLTHRQHLYSSCNPPGQIAIEELNMTSPMIVITVITVLVVTIYVVLFSSKYNRLTADNNDAKFNNSIPDCASTTAQSITT